MNYASRGKLYIVATPIGHLSDMTYRGVDVLKNVDLILAEDTREADKLLKRYDIRNSIISYTDQKHKKIQEKIFEILDKGNDVALTSDSGTPLISDPGFRLVQKAKKDNYEVVCIPGVSAPIAALSISGLPTDKFLFLGFLPKSKAKRKKILGKHKEFDGSLIIFESPYKINSFLEEISDVYGNRTVSVIKDLTKKFERVITNKIDDIKKEKLKEKGEYTVIVAKEGYILNG